MCLLCAEGVVDRALARRAHVLQLLALVEHPDALPAEAVLRLGGQIMMLIRPDSLLDLSMRRCDSVTPPGPRLEGTR